MAKAKQKHYALDVVNEFPSHHGRNASELAHKHAIIPFRDYVANLKIFKAAGSAKHVSPRRRNNTSAWADIKNHEHDENRLLAPPASGNKKHSKQRRPAIADWRPPVEKEKTTTPLNYCSMTARLRKKVKRQRRSAIAA